MGKYTAQQGRAQSVMKQVTEKYTHNRIKKTDKILIKIKTAVYKRQRQLYIYTQRPEAGTRKKNSLNTVSSTAATVAKTNQCRVERGLRHWPTCGRGTTQ